MKFTVNSNELATLLQNVGRLVPTSNTSIPALANYLFEVYPDHISVTVLYKVPTGTATYDGDGDHF